MILPSLLNAKKLLSNQNLAWHKGRLTNPHNGQHTSYCLLGALVFSCQKEDGSLDLNLYNACKTSLLSALPAHFVQPLNGREWTNYCGDCLKTANDDHSTYVLDVLTWIDKAISQESLPIK